jgi:SAM-dependent methyltransferase
VAWWRGLAAHLAAVGLDAAYVAKALRGGERLDDALRAPMRKWNLRRRREPAAYAMRLFLIGDAVSEDEARGAVGDFAPLVDAGLLARDPDGLVARLRLTVAGGMYFLSDLEPGHGAVLGPSANTLDLVRAARPDTATAALADVGTGCGAAALLLAHRASRVVATDVSPRATDLTRLNAMMNGVTNVEARTGDLFEPLEEERFDAVVSHPPFLPGNANGFSQGGERGDELALRLLAGLPPRLAERGRATLVLDWPVVGDDAPAERVRRALGDASLDVLLVESPGKSLDEHCTFHAAAEHRALGPAFEAEAIAQRDRLERLGVVDLRTTLTLVARAEGRAGFTDAVRVRHFADAPPAAEQLARIMRARDLVARGDAALMAARLRVPPGTRFDVIHGAEGACAARLPHDRLVAAPAVTPDLLALLRAVDGAPCVNGAGVPLSSVKSALVAGLLEIAD